MTEERGVEFLNPSPLAFTVARRFLVERERVNQRMSELNDDYHHALPDPMEVERTIFEGALVVERLLMSKGFNKSIRDAIRLNDAYRTGQVAYGNLIPEGLTVSEEQKSQFARQTSETVVDAFLPELISKTTEATLAEIDEAEKLAQEKGIDIEEVFEDGELYKELIRRVHTPAGMASLKMAVINRMNRDLGLGVMRNYYRNILMASLKSEGLFIEGYEAEIDIIISEAAEKLIESPTTEAQIEEMIETFRRNFYIFVAEDTERFWGAEAIEELPEEIKREIEHYREKPQS